jgi:PAS domain S-box-containing protein
MKNPQKAKIKIKFKYTSQILATIVLLLGLLTIIQYTFNINLGIDQFLIKESSDPVMTSHPGRMAPNTALCFFLLGFSLILIQSQNFIFSQFLALISFLIALLGFIGYLFGIIEFYYIMPFSAMAIHTSISFLLLSSGTLIASSRYGWMQELTSPFLGGKICRNTLPFIVIFPLLNAGLFLAAYRLNIINVDMEFLLQSLINISVLGYLVWWNAKSINKIDKQKYYLQQELLTANENLEFRINERTQQLKNINQSLQKSQEKLSNLINTLPGIVFARNMNNDFAVQELSKGFLSIIGDCPASCKSYQKCKFQDLIIPEYIPKIFAAIENAVNTNADNYQVEYCIINFCGQEKWLLEKGVLTSNETSNKIQGYITDITTLKKTQAALQESETKFRTLAENIDEVFHLNSADMTKILYISPAYQKIWGQSCKTLYENPYAWSVSVHPDDRDRILTACQNLIAGQPLEAEYRIIRTDGEIRWIYDRTTPIYDESGQILNYVGVATDITERKQHELEIKQLNEQLEEKVQQRTAQLTAANKELEAFSYSVSHDLRAPLRGIDGFSKILLQRYGDQLDDKGKHYLTRIRAGTQRMGELIDDLLKLSRVTRYEMELKPVNLSAIAQEIAQQLSETEPERRVEWTIHPDLIVLGDAHLLRIVMENLLNNAWKFTSKKIQAKIELTYQLHEHKKNDNVIYIIRDNGVGFDQTYVNKLFTAFQRLHTVEEFPGTGVGLATVQRIIRRHGGDIWAEGVIEEGASFYFTVPS